MPTRRLYPRRGSSRNHADKSLFLKSRFFLGLSPFLIKAETLEVKLPSATQESQAVLV